MSENEAMDIADGSMPKEARRAESSSDSESEGRRRYGANAKADSTYTGRAISVVWDKKEFDLEKFVASGAAASSTVTVKKRTVDIVLAEPGSGTKRQKVDGPSTSKDSECDPCDTTTGSEPPPGEADCSYTTVIVSPAVAKEKEKKQRIAPDATDGPGIDELLGDYVDSDSEDSDNDGEVSLSESDAESDDDVICISDGNNAPPGEPLPSVDSDEKSVDKLESVKSPVSNLATHSDPPSPLPEEPKLSQSQDVIPAGGVDVVRATFTSEIFKIELLNVSRNCGYNELKKLINTKLKLNGHRFKLTSGSNHPQVFVNFKNEEDREKALAVLDGYTFRGQVLKAKHAEAAPDPMLQLQERSRASGKLPADSDKVANEVVQQPIAKLVLDATIPWASDPYDVQIKKKQEDVLNIMQKLTREVYGSNRSIDPHVKRLKDPHADYDSLICEIDEIIRSPVINGYRNKCEFTVGFNPETNERTVGFRISSYNKGSLSVGPIEDLCHLPAEMIKGALAFQSFVRQSIHAPYDPAKHQGVWKQLTVRTTSESEGGPQIMLYVLICADNISTEEVDQISVDLKAYFQNLEGLGVTSFYIKVAEKHGVSEKNLPLLLFGESTITEVLYGLKFRISPDAFFQVNTRATEIMYAEAGRLAGLDEQTTLLDICCGTGTIGLSCLKLGNGKVGEVLGVDWTPSSIVDAKMNADINGLSHKAQYFCGKAEDLLSILLAKAKFPRVVAIVDPPRSGLHASVIQLLRNTSKIKSLVYVACNARSAMQNFVDLSKPLSKRFRGDPFKPIKAVPVDMFPHTPHVELVLAMQRMDM